MKSPQKQAPRQQRGGFLMGLIVGLLAGLALALGVALYISKVPIPFVNKVPQRTAEQDAAETEKNKNWDPNSGLYGRNPAKPSSSASGATVIVPAPSAPHKAPRDPADILADKPLPPLVPPLPATPSAAPSKPLPGDSSVIYFVQAGAYGDADDAEQQRVKLVMMGLTSKVTEREQAGRTVYRVRVGPFGTREDANLTKDKLDRMGVDAALVQVQK